MTMSDRIAVLDAGELQRIAPPLTCYNEPANLFVAGFIGSPAMNLLEGTVDDTGLQTEHFHVDFDPGLLDGVGVGDELTFGVRPEDIYPVSTNEELAHPSETISAKTDVFEPMGDEIFAYLLLGEGRTSMAQEMATSDQLLISVDPDSKIEEDEDIEVVLHRRRIHLFDTATGLAHHARHH